MAHADSNTCSFNADARVITYFHRERHCLPTRPDIMAEAPSLLLGMPEHVDLQAENTGQITSLPSAAADVMGIANDEATPATTGIFEFFSLPPELR
ncbi:hypothetical protein LTR95_018123, partial [Oleoguttula sp. CCFEE 5521]